MYVGYMNLLFNLEPFKISGLIECVRFLCSLLEYAITANTNAISTINRTIPPISPPIAAVEDVKLLLLEISAGRSNMQCDTMM